MVLQATERPTKKAQSEYSVQILFVLDMLELQKTMKLKQINLSLILVDINLELKYRNELIKKRLFTKFDSSQNYIAIRYIFFTTLFLNVL